MRLIYILTVICICIISIQPVHIAKTQSLGEIKAPPVITPEPKEIRDKKDSLINLLNKISEQVKKTQPKVIYKTKWKTEVVKEYISLPADTVYIFVSDTSQIPENDYYIVEPKEKVKKRNWLKKIFKSKSND